MKLFTFPIDPGTTRNILIFKHFVIKLPRTCSWDLWKPNLSDFKASLAVNRLERKNIKQNPDVPGIPKLYFSDPFGFIIIMKRYRKFDSVAQYIKLYDELIKTSRLEKEFWENDACISNFGLDENNQIVKIDLG